MRYVLILTKLICLVILAIPIAAYAHTIGGHILIDYWFDDSVLHTKLEAVANIRGISWQRDRHDTSYCVDQAVAGKAIGPDLWSEKLCKTGPTKRISVYSRYHRKSWALYVDDTNTLQFKRSWVVQ